MRTLAIFAIVLGAALVLAFDALVVLWTYYFTAPTPQAWALNLGIAALPGLAVFAVGALVLRAARLR